MRTTRKQGAMNDPMAEWNDMVTKWLPLIEWQLRAHAIKSSEGERTVLSMTVTKKHMRELLATKTLPPGTTTRFEMDPTVSIPIEAFLDSTRQHHVDPTFSDRVRPLLEAMDPARDVALFLSSSAADAPNGEVYTRFLMLAQMPQ
jgi:hypothetical protein